MTYCVQGFASGRVQGVHYRQFTQTHARALQVTGWVKNLDDGRVAFTLSGHINAVEQLLTQLREGPPHANVIALEYTESTDATWDDFTILR